MFCFCTFSSVIPTLKSEKSMEEAEVLAALKQLRKEMERLKDEEQEANTF